MINRKKFTNKKELIKYILDADSNAEEYILEIPENVNPQSNKNVIKEISGLWYAAVAKQIRQIKQPIKTLNLTVSANWWFTQIGSDSRYQVGEEAFVDKKWHQVSELAEAIQNCQYLTNLQNLNLQIIHPLLKEHYDQLVEALNKLQNLKKIQIDFPCDTGTYYIEKNNWTEYLKVKPIIKLTESYFQSYQE